MDPKTAISYSLILCFVVDIGIGLSSVEGKIGAFNTTFDIIDQSAGSTGSVSELIKRYKRVPKDNEYEHEEEEDVDGAPPDHTVPYTSHEDPEEPSSKPEYSQPGEWAKPPPDRNIPLDFVPTKLYAQVRGTHTVKRLPREEAIKAAATTEELLSAPRLREVVSKSKKNTIYTEEGYEDSAYDHAGHVRDADFHEGFAKKLEGKQTSKQGSKEKPVREKQEIKDEESESDEDFKEYNDDYRDHVEESSRVEELKPLKRRNKKAREEYKKIKAHWQDDVNPKKVTENEIERLEEDLQKEYAESEKNVEDEPPENLKNPGSDYDDEADEYNGEPTPSDGQGYGLRTRNTNSGESAEASSETSTDGSSESDFSAAPSVRDEENQDSSTTPVNPTEFRPETVSPTGYAVYETTQNFEGLPTDSPTPNYGQIFWDYFKQAEDAQRLKNFSTPSSVGTTTIENVNPVSEEFTSIPNLASVLTTIRGFDISNYSPAGTDSSDYVYLSNSESPVHAKAASLYESWKREGREADSEESPEIGSLEGPTNSYPTDYEQTTEYDEVANNVDGTTVVAPKKLSYKVIIRAKDKTTTAKAPRNREIRKGPEETNSFVQVTNPKYTKMMRYVKDQSSPQEINDIALNHQDFTAIQPPPRPVTYPDFLPDTYASHLRPSVTQESGQLGEKIHAERDRYVGLKSPNDKRFSNIFRHPPESPQFYHRHGHHSPLGHRRNHLYRNLPPTKLLPPSPIVRSKYADYLSVRRTENPLATIRFEHTQPSDPWSGLVQFYRSIDQGIFGRRRRRSLESKRNIEQLMHTNQFRKALGSNFLGSNLGNWDITRDNLNASEKRIVGSGQQEKFAVRRKRDHEDLLNESPNIAEKEINAEIDLRFNNKEKDDEEEEKYENSKEKEHGKVDVEVPEINVAEIIESGHKNNKVIAETTRAKKLDVDKYPFYKNSKIPQSSALKYITNPRQVPRKTLGGTEFYDSRDKYLECDEVEPNLEKVVPEEEEPRPDREAGGDEPRLGGLGDKLDCFRAKYFDENPLDNPLFLEPQIDEPRAPKEFDAAKFASRIFSIPDENEQQNEVVARISRKPEYDLTKSESNKHQVSEDDKRSNRLVYNKNPKRDKEQSTKNRESRRKVRRRKKKKKPKQEGLKTSQHYAVLPYQRQVYEDVMGTIKNLAGMNQGFAEPPLTPLRQPNGNYAPDIRDHNWNNYPVVQITEKPQSYLIQGLLPSYTTAVSAHQPLHRYRVIPYRTNKVSYRTKVKTEIPVAAGEGVKVGYFKTVRVHKRSIDDDKEKPDMDAAESRNIAVLGINNSSSGTSIKQTSQGTGKDETPVASDRAVYTIYDRIRFSKPRGKYGRNPRFTNLEAAGTEDVRRQEPRYNKIERRKVTPLPISDSLSTNREQVGVTSTATSDTKQDRTTGRHDFHHEPGEVYKIQFSTIRGTKAAPTPNRRGDNESTEESYDGENESGESGESENEKPRKNNYHVHENVDDDVTTVSRLTGEPTESPEFLKIQEYLKSDPPGYSKAFAEDSAENVPKYEGTKDKEEEDEEHNEDVEGSTKPYDTAETNKDEEKEEEEQAERPMESYADEESSPRSGENGSDSPANSESYKNDEDDEEEDSSDLEKDFDHFVSRPYPPFDGSEEKGSKKFTRYIYPWERDEAEDAEESKNVESSFERFEFPWEKKARRLREEKKREKARKEYDKLFGYSDSDEDEEEQNASNTRFHRSRVYPAWIYDNTPARKPRRQDTLRKDPFLDNIEVGTEYQPVTRFSSRYKSNVFDFNDDDDDDDDPIVVSGADPNEIRVSVIKSIRNVTDSKPAKRSKVSKVIVSVNVTTVATTTLSDSDGAAEEPSSTIATRRSRNGKASSMSRNSTVRPTTINSNRTSVRPMRTLRITSTTTKRPIRFRKRLTSPVNELLKSGSQKREVIAGNPVRNNLNSSLITASNTSTVSAIDKKIRQRGPLVKPASNSIVTSSRPLRRKLPKMTVASKATEGKTTTPKSETIQHRTSFSEESIITKTSYPGLNSYNDREKGNKNSSKNGGKGTNSKKLNNSKNETVKKVSIMTKETPDHIYHREEIDSDGVKGSFLSITPNNGSLGSMEDLGDRNIDNEDAKAILKRFEHFDDKEIQQDTESSFMHDSLLMANLLRQVPPITTHFTFSPSIQGVNGLLSKTEGSGNGEFDEDTPDHSKLEPKTKYEKNPNARLYYYLED